MNRLDPVSGMLAEGSGRGRTAMCLRGGTWAALAMSLVAAGWAGAALESGPAEAAVRAAAELPRALLLVDLWALGIVLFRRSGQTPLRVPLKTPLALAVLHLGIWAWARTLAPIGAGGHAVRIGSTVLLGLLSSVSLVAAVLETRLVRWVLISEETAASREADGPEAVGEPDVPAGGAYVYEAQLLLNRLGYEAGEPDGKMKAGTREALRQFQRACRLEPCGEVTMLTVIELRNRASGEAQRPGPAGPAEFRPTFLQRVKRWPGRWRGRNG